MEPLSLAITEFGLGRGTPDPDNDEETAGRTAEANAAYQERAAVSLDCIFRPYKILSRIPKDDEATEISHGTNADRLPAYTITDYGIGHEIRIGGSIEDDTGSPTPPTSPPTTPPADPPAEPPSYSSDDIEDGPYSAETPATTVKGTEGEFGVNSYTLNPFMGRQDAVDAGLSTEMNRGNDMQRVARGDSWPEAETLLMDGNDRERTKALRPLALKSPLILCGWGFDVDGQPVPGEGGKFVNDWLSRSDKWKVGPLDCRWNEERKVWEASGGGGGGGGSNVVRVYNLKYHGGKWKGFRMDGQGYSDEELADYAEYEIVCEDFLGILGTSDSSLEDFKVGDGLNALALKVAAKPDDPDTEEDETALTPQYVLINAWGNINVYPLFPKNYKDIPGYIEDTSQAIVLEAGGQMHFEDIMNCQEQGGGTFDEPDEQQEEE